MLWVCASKHGYSESEPFLEAKKLLLVKCKNKGVMGKPGISGQKTLQRYNGLPLAPG